jgi:glycosyltransferase involved in cell wall biosynthesis
VFLSPTPKVTVITACRNAARTIQETILSVINQEYDNIEYIVVDANSDDGTADIISRYEQNISLWIREPDKGIADAWNKGIRNASGDIVGIINADDLYTPSTVATIVDALARDEDCGFVYGDLKVVDDGLAFRHVEKGRPDYERTTRYDMLHVPHPTVFVGRSTYNRIGLFDTRYRIASDYEFIRRMATNKIRGTYIPETLAIMRQGGVSQTHRTAAFREVMAISIVYGRNPLAAACYFCFKLMRTYLGKALDQAGIEAPARRKMRRSLPRVRGRVR